MNKELAARKRTGRPVTEEWWNKKCATLGIDPERARITAASKGWISRISRHRFFPANNHVSKELR